MGLGYLVILVGLCFTWEVVALGSLRGISFWVC